MTYKHEGRRIGVLGAAIFTLATAIAGMAVFIVMQRHAQSILGTTLELSLQSRSSLFETGLHDGLSNTITIATRPFIIQQVNKFNQVPGDPDALLAMRRAAVSFLPMGLSGVAISGKDGQDISRAGEFVGTAKLQVPIKSDYQASLLWSDGFVLRTQIDILDKGVKIGSVLSEARLPGLTNMLFDVRTLGETAELAICAPLDTTLNCFPTTLLAEGGHHIPQTHNNKPLPMNYAVHGKSGLIITEDYRAHPVVAAYRPVGSTGLGMVLKLDLEELYQPIKRQLIYVLPIIILLIVAGMMLLRWLVAPLVRKLVQSEYEARRINAELSDSETRLRLIFDNVDEGIIIINSAGIIQSFNPAMERIFGYKAQDAIGCNVSMLMPEPHRHEHNDYLYRYLRTREPHIIGKGREVEAMRNDGSIIPVDLRVSEMKLGSEMLFVATLRDISQRKLIETQMLHLATHDPLTDLPNRMLLIDRLGHALTQANRRHTKVALLYIDLDGFKFINDKYGHECGDLLLVSVAKRITSTLRQVDTVARQGGDEFIIVLPDIETEQSAREVAEKLLDVLSSPYVIQGRQLKTAASIGISIYPDHGMDAETLIRAGDMAMYSAKQQGRNRFQTFVEAVECID